MRNIAPYPNGLYIGHDETVLTIIVAIYRRREQSSGDTSHAVTERDSDAVALRACAGKDFQDARFIRPHRIVIDHEIIHGDGIPNYLLERGAVRKCTVLYLGHPFGDGDGGQTVAVIEGFFAYARHALRDGDGGQTGASVKRFFAYRGDASVGGYHARATAHGEGLAFPFYQAIPGAVIDGIPRRYIQHLQIRAIGEHRPVNVGQSCSYGERCQCREIVECIACYARHAVGDDKLRERGRNIPEFTAEHQIIARKCDGDVRRRRSRPVHHAGICVEHNAGDAFGQGAPPHRFHENGKQIVAFAISYLGSVLASAQDVGDGHRVIGVVTPIRIVRDVLPMAYARGELFRLARYPAVGRRVPPHKDVISARSLNVGHRAQFVPQAQRVRAAPFLEAAAPRVESHVHFGDVVLLSDEGHSLVFCAV